MVATPGGRRAQVGIGTLIVFIAMVLVASMAAGVLVDTAGVLQSKSEQTGQEASDAVLNRLQVTSKVGRVSATGDRNYVVIDEGYEDRDIESYDARLRLPEGQKIRLSTAETQKLIVDGEASPTYDAGTSAIYRVSKVDGNKIRFEDLTNDVVVNTVAPPITLGTSKDHDLKLGYPDDQIVDPEDEIFFGASSLGGETATANFLGASKVWTADLTVRAGPGAGAIDLTEATVVYRSARRVERLSYASDGDADETSFAVTPLADDGDGVLNGGERAEITIDVDAVEGQKHGLPLGEEAEITILTRSAKVTVPLSPPDTASGRPYVEL